MRQLIVKCQKRKVNHAKMNGVYCKIFEQSHNGIDVISKVFHLEMDEQLQGIGEIGRRTGFRIL